VQRIRGWGYFGSIGRGRVEKCVFVFFCQILLRVLLRDARASGLLMPFCAQPYEEVLNPGVSPLSPGSLDCCRVVDRLRDILLPPVTIVPAWHLSHQCQATNRSLNMLAWLVSKGPSPLVSDGLFNDLPHPRRRGLEATRTIDRTAKVLIHCPMALQDVGKMAGTAVNTK